MNKDNRAVNKFLKYLEQEKELYDSYEMAIEMMIVKETNPLNIKRLNKLKMEYKGR